MTDPAYYCPNLGEEQDMVATGETLDRYLIKRRISGGTFGQVFFGIDGEKEVAIKVEATNSKAPLLDREAACLRHLNSVYKKKGEEPVLEYFDYGEKGEIRYLVMECAGRNLYDLRKANEGAVFSIKTSLWILFKMMHTMKIIHSHGWLHRDVKPANFCIGRNNQRQLFVIDFGFCRHMLNEDGTMKPRRPHCRFYGTFRYASLNSHQRQDFSRWDDLISVFYIAIENLTGRLPWANCQQMSEIIRLKQNFNVSDLSIGECEYPPPSLFYLQKTLPYINQKPELFYVEPKYKEYITNVFNDLVARNFSYKTALDWEMSYETEKPIVEETMVMETTTEWPTKKDIRSQYFC